jgi:hypothetical protein
VLPGAWRAALGDGWAVVLQELTKAHSKLTRQEILDNWSADYHKPDSTTLWRWLSRAVAGGIVRQEGTGRSRDPFRYWLPQHEEFLRPEGGSAEALQAWNARCLAETFPGLDWPSGAPPTPEAPLSGTDNPTVVSAVAAVPAGKPLEPVPPPDGRPETAASPSPEPPPSRAAPPVAAEAAVRLPYPFSLMNLADVPEEVWKRARAAQQNTW